jgi:hypothetical protein
MTAIKIRVIFLRSYAVEFDGIFFIPDDEDDEAVSVSHFSFKDEYANGKPVGSTSMGDMFHVAFFVEDEDGLPKLDGAFEAIFGDPTTYVKGLVGSNVFGCLVRKTDKSQKWFDEYLTDIQKSVILRRMIRMCKSIAETK